MFERGLFIDDNWVSNGEAFWQPIKVKQVKFIERFMVDRDKATVELQPISDPYLHDNHSKCILFSDNDTQFIPVQVCNLELIGVNLDFMSEYMFMMNPDTHLIYVYDPDFIGGVLPVMAKNNPPAAYPNITKELEDDN